MKMNLLKKIIAVLLLSSIVSLFQFAHAEDEPIPSPHATFTVDIKVYALIDGQTANTSTGVLTYQGKQYPFTVSGIGLGANKIGATHLVGSGVVYYLKDLNDFAGTYTQVFGGVMLEGHAKLLSNKGVGIHFLIGSTNGPVVIAPTGVVIEFAKQ